MRKRLFALLLCLALPLSACGWESVETPGPSPTAEETATPSPSPTSTPESESSPEEVTELWGFPIDDTHDAFEVPTGGKLGTVLVTVEMNEEEFLSTVSVWDTSDLTKPIQTMEEEGAATHNRKCLDVNFDGHMDFTYTWAYGARNDDFGLYLWEEERGRFVPGGNFLGHLEIDKEKETVRNYSNGAGSSGTTEIFRWEDGKLSCVRQVEIHYPEMEGEEIAQTLTVEDCVNGEWTEIYREAFGGETDIYEEASLWYDLDYHGEVPETLWGFPIDDTHDAFEVPTGGKLGTMLVTVEQEEDPYHLNFSVWKSDDLTTPIQVVTTESERHWEELEDINFDGYMDFMYLSSLGAANAYYSFWIWDEEQERFCEKEGLFNPIFDTETQMISSYTHYSAVSGVQSYWHWEDDELVMLRRIETYYPEFEGGTDTQLLTVEDRIDGELTEVYRETFGDPNNGEIYDEAEKWKDLNYHGE